MRQNFDAVNHLGKDSNPAGGNVSGVGLHIEWQKGPMAIAKTQENCHLFPKKTVLQTYFLETVLAAALQRIQFYQDRKFTCSENARAIEKVQDGLQWLDRRTMDREGRQVEGTHQV